MVQKNRLRTVAAGVLLVIAAMVMCMLGIRFLNESAFQWTFTQSEYRNAVLEMALMAWVFFGLLSVGGITNRTRFCLVITVFLIQTYLRSYFWAIIGSILYLFVLGMTGYLICKKVLRQNDAGFELHKYVLFGMASEIILVALMSVFSVAYPATLRYVILCVGLAESFLLRKGLLRGVQKLFGKPNTRMQAPNSVCINIALAVCLTGITLIACRANQGFDYDSMWYGIQAEYVLVPNGSIYNSPDLMSIVFTYAKGYEVVSLPFAGLTSYSFFSAFNLALVVLTMICVYQICREFGMKQSGVLTACFVAVTPSIMVMAMTAKADVITLYISMVAIRYAVCFFRSRNSVELDVALSAIILSYGMKQTSLLFSTLILLCTVFVALLFKIRISKKTVATILIPTIALSVLIVRTILKAGLPYNALVVSFFKRIGIEPLYPYYFPSSRMTGLTELLSDCSFLWTRITRLLDIFFCPKSSDLSTTMISWWGPLVSFIWLLSLILPLLSPKKVIQRCRNEREFLYLTVVHYSLSAFSVASMLLLDAPDGNYFILAQTLSYIYLLCIVRMVSISIRHVIAWASVPMILVNFLVECCISPAWSLGLSPVNLEDFGYYDDYKSRYNSWFAYNDLTDVYEYLEQNEHRALICSIDNISTARFLPTAVETYDAIYNWGSQHLRDADSFYKYLSFAKIDALLIEADAGISLAYYEILLELAENGYLFTEFENERYLLMGVRIEAAEIDDNVVIYLQNILGINSTSPMIAS